jgi:SAM-dependent methyltransferase
MHAPTKINAPAHQPNSFETYWSDAFPRVEGWVDARLAPWVQLIGSIQRDQNIRGNIGEIGVYHGKFLIALAHLSRPGEKVTAIDVFDDQEKNLDGAGVGSLERLRKNISAYAPPGLDYEFIKADSIALTPVEKAKIMESRGPFRLFSVDGCHTAEHTFNDLLTAQDFLSPGGVLILDDFMQPHWPGVTEAVHNFYGRTVPRIKPFLYACHKLFFVGYGWHSTYFKVFAEQAQGRSDMRISSNFGSSVVTLYP